MKKIGISTVFTGYNYGSSLQAFAVKQIIKGLGYEPVLLTQRKTEKRGRDIRVKKITLMALRILFNPNLKKGLKAYRNSFKRDISLAEKQKFDLFQKKYLEPKYISWHKLKVKSRGEEYKAFVCGSDQIWNASAIYVDPFYYLEFAPYEKRIALAPSFGRNFVPDYNIKKISKYISRMKSLSVREDSGREIISNLIKRDSEVILDPTLLLKKENWFEFLEDVNEEQSKPYILCYFLDKPSNSAQEAIEKLAGDNDLDIISIPYSLNITDKKCNTSDAGPIEFLNLVRKAQIVCTDSFHGTAFSVNFGVPFYTFERDYGNADRQSARIESLLRLFDLAERYEPKTIENPFQINFVKCDEILEKERKKANDYLISAID